MRQNREESDWFETNEEYKLKKISFNKKILYYGYITLIIILIIYSLIYEKFIIPGKRSNYEFSSYSLYLLILSGLIFIFHFSIQLIGQSAKNENENNVYYKYMPTIQEFLELYL